MILKQISKGDNHYLKNSSHLEWRVGLSDTILKGTHPGTIYSRFGLYIDASCQVWLHLAKPVSEEKTVCPWRPYLLVERNEMEKLYRGPYIDAYCQVWFHLAKLFQRIRIKYEKVNGRMTDANQILK